MDDDSSQDTKWEASGRIPSREWLILSLMSFAVYLGISYLVFYFFHDTGPVKAYGHGLSVINQLITGIGSGVIGSAIIWIAINQAAVSKVLDDFYIIKMVRQSRLTSFDCMQLSFFAGAGEELLFRGAIQPLLGIWVTSVIFVGLHGYFKFKSPGHIIFGGIMFGLSAGLGYLFEYAGLIAAMSAHATYDVIMLKLISYEK
ncbi:CPBP family intramembrane metalloprotease [Aliifodinibius salicampi]|uniref:CPBP family intramembrane metalloprotease n=1 Tax=Fodinibius salicampi TaxID=1920655 RepID=A0ABT3Q0C7_9BACT|nr:CPBP family intramembrane glutamic endopeptidase [Fodinibius salicampi]MCW9713508.1 CPBP family intramembrane metalloprotease [Fodinibius salicampi]